MRFRAVFDQAMDSLGILRPDGTVIEMNESAAAYGNVSPGAGYGRPVWEVPLRCASVEARARLQQAVAAAAAGTVVREETDVVTADNRTATVDLSLKPIRDAAGAVTTILFEGRDVTEQRRVQAALEDNKAMLQLILDTAPIGIIRIDEQGTILSFNRAAEETFGYAANEIVGRNVKLLMTPVDQAQHDERLARYLRTGEARIIGIGREVVGQRKNGGTFPLELAVGEIKVGRRHNFTGFVRDVSLRRQAETKLRQQQTALAHAMRMNMMGAMASAIAHELNQPLTAVASYAQACLRMLGSVQGGPPELGDAMRKLVAQTLRAGEIIRHVRGFLRKEEPRRANADINEIVRAAAGFEAFEAGHEKVDIVFDLADDLPQVSLDRVQIEQVALNLVRNAVQALVGARSRRRIVTVRTRAGGRGFVEVAVSDTGPGIPVEIMQRLFEPFTTARPDGMGLGLSICRSIIDAHGGKLSVGDGPDGGATVRFTLPVAEPDGSA